MVHSHVLWRMRCVQNHTEQTALSLDNKNPELNCISTSCQSLTQLGSLGAALHHYQNRLNILLCPSHLTFSLHDGTRAGHDHAKIENRCRHRAICQPDSDITVRLHLASSLMPGAGHSKPVWNSTQIACYMASILPSFIYFRLKIRSRRYYKKLADGQSNVSIKKKNLKDATQMSQHLCRLSDDFSPRSSSKTRPRCRRCFPLGNRCRLPSGH